MAVSITADPRAARVQEAIEQGALTECWVCDGPLPPEAIIHFDGVHTRCLTPELLAEMDEYDSVMEQTAAWLRGHGYASATPEACRHFLGGGIATPAA